MKFQVPQFIDIEDKIFGPLSFKEFIYVLGGCGISYIIYRFVPFFLLAVALIIPVMSFAIALAFYKPNNKPFIDMVESALIYFMGNKLYTWKKTNKPITPKKSDSDDIDISSFSLHTSVPSLAERKISDTSRTIELNNDAGINSSKVVHDKLNIKI